MAQRRRRRVRSEAGPRAKARYSSMDSKGILSNYDLSLWDVTIPLNTGDFRLIDRRVVDALLSMPERDRFVRGMVAWVGFRQVAVPYRRKARFAGATKYPFSKMVRFAVDGVLSFSLVPLRIAIWIGFFAAVFAVIGIVYALILRLLTTCGFLGGHCYL